LELDAGLLAVLGLRAVVALVLAAPVVAVVLGLGRVLRRRLLPVLLLVVVVVGLGGVLAGADDPAGAVEGLAAGFAAATC